MKAIDELLVLEDTNFEEEHNDVSQDGSIVFSSDDSSSTSIEGLKSLLKKHLWRSISDLGLPSSLRPHHPPPVYLSSPLCQGGFDVEKQPILMGNSEVHQPHVHNHDQGEIKKAILKTIWSKTLSNKGILKWVFIFLNVILEVCQVTLTQEKNERKIDKQTYLKLSISTSSICLIIALIEALHEGKKFGVVWQKRGICCWFYYPENQGRVFGRVSLYFAIISSLIQLIMNLIAKLTKKDSVQFDYMQLLLAICYLGAAISGSRDNTSTANILIRCNVHGIVDAECTFHVGQERRAFHCPQCQKENYYDELVSLS